MFFAQRTITSLLMVLVVLLGSRLGWAQDVNLARIRPGSERIHSSFGLDPALVTTFGYSHGFGLGARTWLWDVELGVAVARADSKDLRLRGGLQTTVLQRGNWRLAGRGRLIARNTSNSVYDGAAFGADFTASVGFHHRRWFAAGSIGYDRTLVMHIEHTRWYRQTSHAGAVDGWYRGEGGILHGGVGSGLVVGSIEFAVRVEWRRLGHGETLDPPIVGDFSIAYVF